MRIANIGELQITQSKNNYEARATNEKTKTDKYLLKRI